MKAQNLHLFLSSSNLMEIEGEQTAKRVCVTGAAGYIGSWLVKNLLERGFTVNATLRNPDDRAKSGPLMKLPGAEKRLKLFKADLSLEGSFDSAVEGCHGVFHVANPMDFTKPSPDDFIVPAVNGVRNIMKACVTAKSIRRFVYTSSVAAASPRNELGEFGNACLDESCWSPINFLKSRTNNVAWYAVAKSLAEQEAFSYGLSNGIEVVSLLPGLVIGPWLTSTSDITSIQTVLGLLTGNNVIYEMLKFTEFMLGSMPIVHIDDTCNAHIFLMEHTDIQNRYVCASESMSVKCLQNFLYEHYPQFGNSIRLGKEDEVHVYLPASSQKLLDVGFSYKYQLQEALDETIECAIKHGLLHV